MAVNNIYHVDMEKRYLDFQNGTIDMRNLHPMVYNDRNVALAVRQLSQSPGKMALEPDGTNYKTLENYSVAELGEIVKERLPNQRTDYVRRAYIPKATGKMRPLGVCSIWDKLVEKCIQLVVEPYCETKFVPSSFGFRERVSTHNALAKVKNECQTKPYVLAVDMKDYFGTIDPDITYRKLCHIGVKDQVILNYIYHFIKKGYFEDSCKVEDPKGSPQGSIPGPLISNVYLHRFDVWLRDQGDCWHDPTVKKFHEPGNRRWYLEKTNLKVGIHVRYADDILVLCKDYEDAKRFRYNVTKYMTKNMKLIVNEDKTKIYDITQEKMKYLGYDFCVFPQNSKHPKKKGRFLVANTLPKARADGIAAQGRTLLRKIRKHPRYDTFHE